jgi:hypothetical protein
MSTTDHTTPGGSRRLVLTGAVSVALISTASAYLAMVGFGVDVLGMDAATAYTTAGVFELSLITVALLAREAARDNRPGGVLLSLTWALSSASGVFAAVHEVYMSHPAGAVLFRFIVPLLAALMWHLALIGDRHLATGSSWSGMRATARMHALFLTVEDAARAHAAGTGTPTARRTIARAEARRRRARAIALRTVPPEQMRAKAADHLDALAALADATTDVARLHMETNDRVAGLTPAAAPVLSGPGYEDLAADAVRAELEDMTEPGSPDGDRLSVVSAAGQDRPRVRAAVRTAKPRTSARTSGHTGTDKAARLAVVSDLLTTTPTATATDALSALSTAGHDVTDRTARRLLVEARTTRTAPATAPALATVEA